METEGKGLRVSEKALGLEVVVRSTRLRGEVVGASDVERAVGIGTGAG